MTNKAPPGPVTICTHFHHFRFSSFIVVGYHSGGAQYSGTLLFCFGGYGVLCVHMVGMVGVGSSVYWIWDPLLLVLPKYRLDFQTKTGPLCASVAFLWSYISLRCFLLCVSFKCFLLCVFF